MVFGMACLASSEAYAVAIGMPEQTGRIGFAIGFANLSVKDPSGDTDAEWVVRPLNLIYTDKAFDSYRYWAEGFYQDAVLSPSTSSIGQEVKQLGIKASLQTEVATHVIGTSWLGAGLQRSSKLSPREILNSTFNGADTCFTLAGKAMINGKATLIWISVAQAFDAWFRV